MIYAKRMPAGNPYSQERLAKAFMLKDPVRKVPHPCGDPSLGHLAAGFHVDKGFRLLLHWLVRVTGCIHCCASAAIAMIVDGKILRSGVY